MAYQYERQLKIKLGQNVDKEVEQRYKKSYKIINKEANVNCKYSNKLKDRIRFFLNRNYKPAFVIKKLRCAPSLVYSVNSTLGFESIDEPE